MRIVQVSHQYTMCVDPILALPFTSLKTCGFGAGMQHICMITHVYMSTKVRGS